MGKEKKIEDERDIRRYKSFETRDLDWKICMAHEKLADERCTLRTLFFFFYLSLSLFLLLLFFFSFFRRNVRRESRVGEFARKEIEGKVRYEGDHVLLLLLLILFLTNRTPERIEKKRLYGKCHGTRRSVSSCILSYRRAD